jgi:hypothetical protein
MKMLFGGILLAIGGLIALLSGACSMWFLVSIIGSATGADAGGIIMLVLFVGGIPFAIGLGLFFWGRSLVRSAREDERS